VHAYPHGVSRAAKDDRDLAVVQAFPCVQREEFALLAGQSPERRRDPHWFPGKLRRPVIDGQVSAQPVSER
jgi:hypothetical protein